MNDHEISQLSYDQVIKQFGSPPERITLGTILLSAGSTANHPVDDPGPVKLNEYVIAARVIEINDSTMRIKTRNISKHYPAGNSVMIGGDEWTDTRYFSKTIAERISEQREFFK